MADLMIGDLAEIVPNGSEKLAKCHRELRPSRGVSVGADGKLTRFEQMYDRDQDGISDEDDVITQVRYAYDALDRRVSKEVTQQKFKYVKQKSKPKKPHPKETFTQRFTYLGLEDRIVLARAGDQTLSLYLDGQGIDEHLGVASEKDVFAYETDHLGSVLNTDPAGYLRGYGAFGETIGFGPWITKHSDPVMYGFAGRAYDAESDLYYNRARMYDPTTGRFMTKDPLEPQQGGDINPYLYALNNPAKFVDPEGKSASAIAGLILPTIVFEVAFDVTTFAVGLANSGSFSQAKDLVIQNSPLNNLVNIGSGALLPELITIPVQALTGPNMYKALEELKNRNNKIDSQIDKTRGDTLCR